jgi:hypothetical protein
MLWQTEVIWTLAIKVFKLIHLWLYSPLLDLGRFFSFLILYKVGSPPLVGDQRIAGPLPTHRTTQTQNKRTQTSMPQVEFEPTIPVFERAKTVHALDRAATVIGDLLHTHPKVKPVNMKIQRWNTKNKFNTKNYILINNYLIILITGHV